MTGRGKRKRREFVRIPAELPVRLTCLVEDDRMSDHRWVRGLITELGGGGARLEAAVELGVGDVVCIRFKLPDTEEDMRLYARVVGELRRDKRRFACIKFVGLSETERGSVLSYAFREQIRQAKENRCDDTVPAGAYEEEDESHKK